MPRERWSDLDSDAEFDMRSFNDFIGIYNIAKGPGGPENSLARAWCCKGVGTIYRVAITSQTCDALECMVP
jgi:hypothetical protein